MNRIMTAVLIFGMVLAWSSAATAGVNESRAFRMGEAMGWASYRASVKNDSSARAHLGKAQSWADHLTNSGLLPKLKIKQDHQGLSGHALHDRVGVKRKDYYNLLKAKSSITAEAYRLGLHIGIAAGQGTSPVWGKAKGAWKFAKIGIQGARNILNQHFPGLSFDHKLLEDATYYSNSFLRNKNDFSSANGKLRNALIDALLKGQFGSSSSSGGPSGDATLFLYVAVGGSTPFITKITSATFGLSVPSKGYNGNVSASLYNQNPKVWKGSTPITSQMYGDVTVQVNVSFEYEKTLGVVKTANVVQYHIGKLNQTSLAPAWEFRITWVSGEKFVFQSSLPQQDSMRVLSPGHKIQKFRPKAMRPGVRPGRIRRPQPRLGVRPGRIQRPPQRLGVRPKAVRPGVRRKVVRPGVRPKVVCPGVRPKAVRPGVRRKVVRPGVRPKVVCPGVRPKVVRPGVRP